MPAVYVTSKILYVLAKSIIVIARKKNLSCYQSMENYS